MCGRMRGGAVAFILLRALKYTTAQFPEFAHLAELLAH